MSTNGGGLTALVVDDELPALSDLGYLLGRDDRVEEVITASSRHRGPPGARRARRRRRLQRHLDAGAGRHGPGPGHLPLLASGRRSSSSPPTTSTPSTRSRVDATDYVMKPVRAERLSEAIRRVVAAQSEKGAGMPSAPGEPAAPVVEDETIPVELGGVTRFINRSQIRYAQAHGDYARLHTDDRLAPRARAAQRARGAVGRVRVRAHPPQHARRAPPRQRGAHGPRPLLGRRR